RLGSCWPPGWDSFMLWSGLFGLRTGYDCGRRRVCAIDLFVRAVRGLKDCLNSDLSDWSDFSDFAEFGVGGLVVGGVLVATVRPPRPNPPTLEAVPRRDPGELPRYYSRGGFD